MDMGAIAPMMARNHIVLGFFRDNYTSFAMRAHHPGVPSPIATGLLADPVTHPRDTTSGLTLVGPSRYFDVMQTCFWHPDKDTRSIGRKVRPC